MLATLLLTLAGQFQPQITEAPSIVAALTHETVEIREDFDGMELVLYGATRGLTIRDEIVVVLRGPGRDLRVMEKTRNFGIWMNSAPLEFHNVPSYYAIASSLPLDKIASPEELRRSGIGLGATLAVHAEAAALANPGRDPQAYVDAMAETGRDRDLYAEVERGVEVLDGGLFRATIALPPLTPVGNYVAEVYLFRDGRPVASRSASLRVEKAGLERILFELAHRRPMLYGLLCVFLAVLAGYLANLAFRRR